MNFVRVSFGCWQVEVHMEREVDAECLGLLTQCDGIFSDISAIEAVACKAEGLLDIGTSKETFLIDTTTSHGDTVISESSLYKPSVGWVTVHATESLRVGLHEWAVHVENQGESGDGSGLMLGIVPKGFNRYDSFISQCGGWCISRAGKLYGNWRRVDNNASVVSLVFGTGDRVIFELDMDTCRMTVRVHEKFIVGEISDMPEQHEVFPAMSCHYRNQSVRFEYHKVRDRSQARRNWIERGLLPHAACILTLPESAASLLPIDSALQLGASECKSALLASERSRLRRFGIVVRAISLANSNRSTSLLSELDVTPSDVTIAELRHASLNLGAPDRGIVSLMSNVTLIFAAQLIEKSTEPSNIALLRESLDAAISAVSLMIDAKSYSSHERAITLLQRAVMTALRNAADSGPSEFTSRIAELAVCLALQSAQITVLVNVCRALLSIPDIVVGITGTARIRQQRRTFAPVASMTLTATIGSSHPKAKIGALPSTVLSFAVSDVAAYCHLKSGSLVKFNLGGTGAVTHASTSALLNDQAFSSMALSTPDLRIVLLLTQTVAGVHNLLIFDQLDCSFKSQVDASTWNCGSPSQMRIVGDGTPHILWCEDENDVRDRSSQKHPVFVAPLNVISMTLGEPKRIRYLHTHQKSLTCNSWVLAPPSEVTIDFGNPESFLRTAKGHVTIELWLRLSANGIAKPETRVIYQHGDRATSGEVFLETAVVEGVWMIRGGSRHDSRSTKSGPVALPLPIPGNGSRWVHVALIFDGRWCLMMDGTSTTFAKNTASNIPVEQPRGTWTCSPSQSLVLLELRVWKGARGSSAIQRDMRRYLRGSEVGLELLCSMDESSGTCVLDRAPSSHHGWIRHNIKTSVDCTRQFVPSPIHALDDCDFEVGFPLPSLSTAVIGSHHNHIVIVVPSPCEASPLACVALHVDAMSGVCRTPMYSVERLSHVAISASGTIILTQSDEWVAVRPRLPLSEPLLSDRGESQLSAFDASLLILELMAISADDNGSTDGKLFVPYRVDIRAEVFQSLHALIKDHYRVVQGANARKTAMWRTDASSKICCVALQLLSVQCEAAIRAKLRPSSLNLVVHNGESLDESTGARIFDTLCTMLNDESDTQPWRQVKNAVHALLPFGVPLFFPSVHHRVTMAIDLLKGNRIGRASSHVLLTGLIDHFSKLEHASAILEDDLSSQSANRLSDLCCLLLQQIADTTQLENYAPSATFSSALSTLQFVLLSSICKLKCVHEKSSSVFSTSHPAKVLDEVVVESSGEGSLSEAALRYVGALLRAVQLLADGESSSQLEMVVRAVGQNAIAVIPLTVEASPTLVNLCVTAASAIHRLLQRTVAIPTLEIFAERLRESVMLLSAKLLRPTKSCCNAELYVRDGLRLDLNRKMECAKIFGGSAPANDEVAVNQLAAACVYLSHRPPECTPSDEIHALKTDIKATLLMLKSQVTAESYAFQIADIERGSNVLFEFAPFAPKLGGGRTRWQRALQLWKARRGLPLPHDVWQALKPRISDSTFAEHVSSVFQNAKQSLSIAENRLAGLQGFLWALFHAHDDQEQFDLVGFIAGHLGLNTFDPLQGLPLAPNQIRSRVLMYWKGFLQVLLRRSDRMIQTAEVDSELRAQRTLALLDVLSCSWHPHDFAILQQCKIPALVYNQVRLFTDDRALRRESSVQRQRRSQFKDFVRRRATNVSSYVESDSPTVRNAIDEASLRAWQALRELVKRGLSCETRCGFALADSVFAEVERDFRLAFDELRDAKYPAVDRIAEHAYLACVFVCSCAPLLPSSKVMGLHCSALLQLASTAVSMIHLQLPPAATGLPDVLLGLLRQILVKSSPEDLQRAAGRDPSTVISTLFAVATGAVACTSNEPLTSSASASACKLLQLLLSLPTTGWAALVATKLSAVIDKGVSTSEPQLSVELAAALTVLGGPVAEIPRVGASLLRWNPAIPFNDRRTAVIVVDVSHATGIATVISGVGPSQFVRDDEVPYDSLCSPPPPLLNSNALDCFSGVFTCVAAALESWSALNRTVIGALCVSLAMRALSVFMSDSNCAASFLKSGVSRTLYDIAAGRPISLPQPLWALEEHCALLMAYHMRTSSRIGAFTMNFGLGDTVLSSALQTQTESAWEDIRFVRQSLHWAGTVENRGDDVHRKGIILTPRDSKLVCRATDTMAPAFELSHGFSAEIVLALSPASDIVVGVPWTVPATWGCESNGEHQLLVLHDVAGQQIAAVTVRDGRLTTDFGFHQQEFEKRAFRGPWHFTLVWDCTGFLIYLNGNLMCPKVFAPDASSVNAQLVHRIQVGGLQVDGATSVFALRLWGHALDRTLLRPFAESVSPEGRLPRFDAARNDLVMETFHFTEGTMNVSHSDTAKWLCELRNDAAWNCGDLPSLAAETDWRCLDDIDVTNPPEGDVVVPRREWLAQLAVMDPGSATGITIATCIAVSLHYARSVTLKALDVVQRPTFHLLAPDAGEPTAGALLRSVDKPGTVAAICANLARYTAFGSAEPYTLKWPLRSALSSTQPSQSTSYADIALNTVAEFARRHLQSTLSDAVVTQELSAFVVKCLSMMADCNETFVIDVPYHAYAPGDTMLHPLILGGWTHARGSLGFDSGRTMDYLTVYADRSQKSQIGKFPDAQGQWPEIPLSSGTWIFVKPTSTAKSLSARFVLKTVSGRVRVSMTLLQVLLTLSLTDTRVAECLLTLRNICSLVSIAHKETGITRICAMRILAALFTVWGQLPFVNRADQRGSVTALLRLSMMMHAGSRRETSAVPRVIQVAFELVIAGHQAQCAFARVPCYRLLSLRNQTLRDLFLCSVDPIHAPHVVNTFSSSRNKPLVGFERMSGPPGIVNFRQRAGLWLAACDKGAQCIRSDIGVVRGRWYFEVRLLQSNSSLSVGCVTKQFKFGDGPIIGAPIFGQCNESWCFDGARLCRWHGGARGEFTNRVKWKVRDVIGIALDLEDGTLTCFHNGKGTCPMYDNLNSRPGRAFYFCVAVNPSGVEINTGGAPFSFDIPDGFLPIDALGDVSQHAQFAPLPIALAFSEAVTSLNSGAHLPAYLPIEPCCTAPGRAGQDNVQILSVDTRVRADDGVIKSGSAARTFKADVVVTSGSWYYEVHVVGEGLIQVGWASEIFAADGRVKVVGDDQHSWAIDGGRMLARHNRMQRSLGRHPWKEGDIVGCCVDIDSGALAFTVNGSPIRDPHDPNPSGVLFHGVKTPNGLSPAISLDPDSSAHVILQGELMRFIPKGFQPIGVKEPAVASVYRHFYHSDAIQPWIHSRSSPEPFENADDAARLAQLIESCALLDAGRPFSWDSVVKLLISEPQDRDYQRVLVLARFSALFEALVRYVHFSGDFVDTIRGPLESAVRLGKSFILSPAVRAAARNYCAKTNGAGEAVKLNVNRRLASQPSEWQHTVMGQIFSLLEEKPSAFFSTSRRLWSISFAGEGADDVGGPYRESISAICREACETALELFQPTPNNSNNVGRDRDRYTFGASERFGLLKFLGSLMGACFRAGEPMNLSLVNTFWKSVVADDLDFEKDFSGLDVAATDAIRFLKSVTSEDDMEQYFDGEFVATLPDGSEIPLFQGGRTVHVEARESHLFAELLSEFRLYCETRAPMAALLSGFHRVVAPHAIWWMRPTDVERLVCGRSDYSVDEISGTVRYENIDPTDLRVVHLFELLREFTPHERALFARFICGRERLSPNIRLKIIGLDANGDDDAKLPTASTCFFWITLPRYTSKDVLKERLVFAMNNCVEIDADFRARDSESAGPRATQIREADDGEFEDYSHLL